MTMSIDPKGTTPGLATKAEAAEKVLNMRCRDAKCDSMQATEIKIAGPDTGQRVYRCAKCGMTRSLNVGGAAGF